MLLRAAEEVGEGACWDGKVDALWVVCMAHAPEGFYLLSRVFLDFVDGEEGIERLDAWRRGGRGARSSAGWWGRGRRCLLAVWP